MSEGWKAALLLIGWLLIPGLVAITAGTVIWGEWGTFGGMCVGMGWMLGNVIVATYSARPTRR